MIWEIPAENEGTTHMITSGFVDNDGCRAENHKNIKFGREDNNLYTLSHIIVALHVKYIDA